MPGIRLVIFSGISVLVAAGAMQPGHAAAKSAPTGSYLDECVDASVTDDTLAAQCPDQSGMRQWTFMDHPEACPGDIGNANGRLVCRASRFRPQNQGSRNSRDQTNNAQDRVHLHQYPGLS